MTQLNQIVKPIPRPTNPQTYVQLIHDPMFVLNNWSFFREGWEAMSQSVVGHTLYTEDQFIKILNSVASCKQTEGEGFLIVLCSEKDSSLVGFAVAYRYNEPFSDLQNLHIAAAYSRTRNTPETAQMFDFAKDYAKQFNFQTISGIVGRLNGITKRFWHERLGFKLRFLGFIYEVT